jgi:hypothetical protein
MTSIDTSPLHTELIHFIGDDHDISIDYELIKKYSKYIDAIKWDDTEVMSVPIPTFNGYNLNQIVDHLAFILDQLHQPIPTLKFDDNPHMPFLKKVGGNVANLKLYLLLALHLDIDIFVNDVITTLHGYTPTVDEFETYFDIYNSILWSHHLHGFKRLAEVMTLHFRHSSNYNEHLKPIIREVLEEFEVPVFHRYFLSACFNLPSPTDVDPVTARQVYIASKYTIIHPSIKHEMPLITGTNNVVVESITTYHRALRIPLEESSNEGLFYFYIHGIDAQNGNINMGQVQVPNGDMYTVYIENDELASVDQFKKYDTNSKLNRTNVLLLGNPREYININLYRQNIHPFIEQFKRIETDSEKYFQWQHHREQNLKFHQYLAERQLLTTEEMAFLQRRHQTSIDNNLDSTKENHRLWINKYDYHQYIPKVDKTLLQQQIELEIDEHKYYTSEGKDVEQSRQHLRNEFFGGLNQYGGLVIILCFYTVKSIDAVSKTIVLSRHLHSELKKSLSLSLYHTPVISQDRWVNRSDFEWTSSFPIYKSINTNSSKNNIFWKVNMSFNTEKATQYEANTLLVDIFDRYIIPLHFFPEYIYNISRYDPEINDYNLCKDTFSLIDPSTVNDIDNVKENSNPISQVQTKIVAYPHDDPILYLQAGITTTFEDDDEEDNLFVSYTVGSVSGKIKFDRTNLKTDA